MKRIVSSFAVGAIGWSSVALAAATITSIDFKVENGESQIQVKGTGPLEYTHQENGSDRQVVIDVKDAKLAKSASRRLDTSSFDSPVSLISPYAVGTGARIVVQLRGDSSPQFATSANGLVVKLGAGGSADSRSPQADDGTPAASAQKDSTNPADPNGPSNNSQAQLDDVAVGKTTPGGKTSEKDTAPKDKMAEFLANRETHRFAGRPVTIQVRDADLVDVFRLIGEASGFNIVMGDDVKGKLTLALTEVPWDQALDLILRTQQLGAERTHNVLRIVSLANLTKEKHLELEAAVAAQASTTRITRVFPISFAKLSDLQTILQKFAASPASQSAATGGMLNEPVLIQADERTNSMLVRDTPENVEKMRKLIEILDTQTPQVMIEAKVIEATESFGNQLNGQFGFTANKSGTPYAGASFNGLSSVGNAAANDVGLFGSSSANHGGAIGLSPVLSFIPGIQRLNAFLNIQESEHKLKVISSPKVVTLDKEKSTIVQSQPVVVQSNGYQNGVLISGTSIVDANLSLDVTPTVTNEGSVLMSLKISRDVPQDVAGGTGSAVAKRNIDTKVLVDSGSTLVIGGIFTSNLEDTQSGFPFLRKLPVIGALFGTSTQKNDKTELFIFITPKVLNEKEAGLNG